MAKPFGYWNQPAQDLAIAHDPSEANTKSGYIRISRENEVQYLHRWLWEQLVGSIPAGHQIDHINGVRTDCRIENLRCVPQVINLRNSGQRSDNTSGVKGVSYWSHGHAWKAQAYHPVTKKVKCRTFSINKHGDQEAFRLACVARNEMLNEFNALGAGYTDKHFANEEMIDD